MDLVQLICKNLKNRNYIYTCHAKKDNSIEVQYRLTVPRWVDNSSLVKNENQSVLYFGSSKKMVDQHRVTIHNIGCEMPTSITNSKALIEKRCYTLTELSNVGDLGLFLSQEREKIFREVRSNILLEQIGNLTKKWNHVSDGKFFYDEKDSKNYPRVYPKPNIKYIRKGNPCSELPLPF